MKIQKPTLGRVVEFTCDHHGRNVKHVAFIDQLGLATGLGHVDLYFLETGEKRDSQVTLCDAAVTYARSVAHDATGETPNTWRYPPRCTDEIEVER